MRRIGLLVLALIVGTAAYGASQGPSDCGNAISPACLGIVEYACGSDDNKWICSASRDPISVNVCTFGFSIPPSATIDGIEVAIENCVPGEADHGTYFNVGLTTTCAPSNDYGTAPQTITFSECDMDASDVFGGAGDPWTGGPPSVAEINSADFGLLIESDVGELRVDNVSMTIYYSVGNPKKRYRVSSVRGGRPTVVADLDPWEIGPQSYQITSRRGE